MHVARVNKHLNPEGERPPRAAFFHRLNPFAALHTQRGIHPARMVGRGRQQLANDLAVVSVEDEAEPAFGIVMDHERNRKNVTRRNKEAPRNSEGLTTIIGKKLIR